MIYNEIRPQTVDKLYGKHLDILKGDIERGEIRSAYLFAGLRGCGKSSSAKMLANYLPNCKLVEINASSESTKKDAEKLITGVNSLGIGISNKVVLIEEIHKASPGFQNAILTPLENPAKGIHWVLCTTEIDKVIDTIQSRCKTILFKPLTKAEIGKVLEDGRKACSKHSLLSERVIELIYRKCGGSARDSLTELELISDTDDEVEMIERLRVVKAEDSPNISNLFYYMYNGESKQKTIKILNSLNQSNIEGIRRTILKIAYTELNKTNSEEDHDYIYAIIKIFNSGVWTDFLSLVEGVLEFYQVWKPRLEKKYEQ